MKKPSIPRNIYNYFVNHWVLCALAMTVSTHWFLILRIAGKDLGLIKIDGSMEAIAVWITWPLIIISIFFAFLKSAADKYNELAKMRGGYILQKMLESVNAVTSKKKNRFYEYIINNKGKTDIKPFGNITQPKRQIESLLENIQVTLSEIFGISRDEIGLSILYRPITKEDWDWLYVINTTNDLDLKTVISNPETTARQIIDGKISSIFFPDKRVGIQHHQYVAGPKDSSFDNIGSVLCRDISIGDTNNKPLWAILSITTYGKQLCDQNDEDAIDKIVNFIIPTFEYRIQMELALLYIKNIMNPKCLSCDI